MFILIKRLQSYDFFAEPPNFQGVNFLFSIIFFDFPSELFIFNDRDLNYYWQEYAGQLPKEQVAIAKRMQVIRPVLLNNSTTFEVVVDNEIAAKDFTALIPELQTYLRGRLKNSKVAMTVRVSEPAETVRAVGRVEKFQMMAQKNQALMQLKDEFGLELY